MGTAPLAWLPRAHVPFRPRYAVSTRPGENRSPRTRFVTRRPEPELIANGPTSRRLGISAFCSIGKRSPSPPCDRRNPAARRASSERFSTPNLLNSAEMWNFTVRTVIFSTEAISLFALFRRTEWRISFCRGLSEPGQATARPSSSNACARTTSRSTRMPCAGTITSKSRGSCPRTRHCIASSPAIRSTVESKPASDSARNCDTPVDLSQNTNTFVEWFTGRFFSWCTNLGNAEAFFTIAFRLLAQDCIRLSRGFNFFVPCGKSSLLRLGRHSPEGDGSSPAAPSSSALHHERLGRTGATFGRYRAIPSIFRNLRALSEIRLLRGTGKTVATVENSCTLQFLPSLRYFARASVLSLPADGGYNPAA